MIFAFSLSILSLRHLLDFLSLVSGRQLGLSEVTGHSITTTQCSEPGSWESAFTPPILPGTALPSATLLSICSCRVWGSEVGYESKCAHWSVQIFLLHTSLSYHLAHLERDVLKSSMILDWLFLLVVSSVCFSTFWGYMIRCMQTFRAAVVP